mmetsp:Transcript_15804/g.29355  ORF Transcript_15804/g.29355 Transcript_15804/m.29355 type:complete len:95 (+) Transcript_15804:840-1124(+)
MNAGARRDGNDTFLIFTLAKYFFIVFRSFWFKYNRANDHVQLERFQGPIRRELSSQFLPDALRALTNDLKHQIDLLLEPKQDITESLQPPRTNF